MSTTFSLHDILASPGATMATRHHARFKDVMEIRAPDGRGVRFDSNGDFIGLLEP
jgi:filamentous hemagglutinin